jgi:hypothetical protein
MAARLMRDPFHTKAVETQHLKHRYATPTSAPQFTRYGTRLIARSGTNHVVVYPVPNRVTQSLPKPKIYSSSRQAPIYAATSIGKGVALVTGTEDPNVLRVEHAGSARSGFQTGTFRVPEEVQIRPPSEKDPLGYCHYLEDTTSQYRWLIQVNDALLWVRVNEDDREPLSAIVDMKPLVTACNMYHYQYFVGGRGNEGSVCLRVQSDGTRQIMQRFTTLPRVTFGYSYTYDYEESEYLMLCETSPGVWRREEAERTGELQAPQAGSVVGVISSYSHLAGNEYTELYGLVILEEDRRSLSIVNTLKENQMLRTPRASSEILHAVVSMCAPEVAYVTARGELTVYSFGSHEVLYRLETEAVS